jgi:hypothetical protein
VVLKLENGSELAVGFDIGMRKVKYAAKVKVDTYMAIGYGTNMN